MSVQMVRFSTDKERVDEVQTAVAPQLFTVLGRYEG